MYIVYERGQVRYAYINVKYIWHLERHILQYVVLGGNTLKNIKLKLARVALDLSQEELADKVGVTRQTINVIEKGNYNPTLNLCISICKVLDKTLDEIFWEDENNENK